jgi:hypothetical protein
MTPLRDARGRGNSAFKGCPATSNPRTGKCDTCGFSPQFDCTARRVWSTRSTSTRRAAAKKNYTSGYHRRWKSGRAELVRLGARPGPDDSIPLTTNLALILFRSPPIDCLGNFIEAGELWVGRDGMEISVSTMKHEHRSVGACDGTILGHARNYRSDMGSGRDPSEAGFTYLYRHRAGFRPQLDAIAICAFDLRRRSQCLGFGIGPFRTCEHLGLRDVFSPGALSTFQNSDRRR